MSNHEIATPTHQLVLQKQRDDAKLALSPDHQAGEVGQPVDRELTGMALHDAFRAEFFRLLNKRSTHEADRD